MDLVQQVCSLELAKKLKELDVKQESLWSWWQDGDKEEYIATQQNIYAGGFGAKLMNLEYNPIKLCSAFTVAELGEMLKESEWRLPYVRENGRWWNGGFDDEPTSDTEANARAKMLIWLKEKDEVRE